MKDYDRCACGKNPATHPDEFNITVSEFGRLDKVVRTEMTAICNNCHEKFKLIQDHTENAQKWPQGTLYDATGRVVLCKCGKPAEGAVIGRESYIAYCSECSDLACEKYEANFVYRANRKEYMDAEST